jgi:nucleoside-diphosphate-sugar epimerase
LAPVKGAVFGAAGFIGRHLTDHLRRQGWSVRAIGRGDDAWRGENLGHVFYCAGLTADFRQRPYEAIAAHVGFAVEVLTTARFESFLYTSSTRVYGAGADAVETARLSVDPCDPSDLYNLSKLTGEAACLASANPAVRIARLSNVFGHDPGSDNFINAIVREAVTTGRVVLQTSPESAKDYIGVQDVCRALAAIAAHGRDRLYNVASGQNTTNADIAAALAAACGCSVTFKSTAATVRFPRVSVERLHALGVFTGAAVTAAIPDMVADMTREMRGGVQVDRN